MKNAFRCLTIAALLGALGSPAWSQQEAPTAAPSPAPASAPLVTDPTKPPAVKLTPEVLMRRWEAIGHLVDGSSAAQNIKKGNAESQQWQQEARATRAKAKQAIEAGELEKADALLRETAKLMFKAAKASAPPELAADKAKADYVARRASTQALLENGQRVAADEKTTRPEFAQAEELIKEADKLAAEGKHVPGRAKLDHASTLLKTALFALRNGKTEDARKEFKTKADEYKYEQARNDDYRQLIDGISQGRDSAWEDTSKLATSLREEADGLAKANDHEAALKKIGASTGQLKSLLRKAGFPIL